MQRRGGSGMKGIRQRPTYGDVVGIILIDSDDDEYLVVTNQGVIMRGKAGAIRSIGRNTGGVRLMKVPSGSEIVSIARYAKAPDEDDELDDADTNYDVCSDQSDEEVVINLERLWSR